MWRAAIAAGWSVERLMSYRVPEGLAERDPVLYGETLLIDAVSAELGLELLEPDYGWLPRLKRDYRQREIASMSLAAARQLPVPRFVKPVDEKLFRSQVYAPGELERVGQGLEDTTLALVSEVVEWQLEVRAFISERRVVTLSAYLRDGELAQSADGEWPLSDRERHEATAFLEEILGDPAVELPPALVIDVGTLRTPGEQAWRWGVVEANPAWASGLCGCDPSRVLPLLATVNISARSVPRELSAWGRSKHER
ncbi:MAG: ATP-grasp domain-containing protein [Polyangiaceae bacterium]|nr:ATP-grasp domain-containing protein [Polyangiaceae bacterium]